MYNVLCKVLYAGASPTCMQKKKREKSSARFFKQGMKFQGVELL